MIHRTWEEAADLSAAFSILDKERQVIYEAQKVPSMQENVACSAKIPLVDNQVE
jgi:hypothetical protein